jgi:uncharacterized protein (TIGR02217 family)
VTESVFPVLPGQGWSVIKTPSFAVRKQTSVSGRELRLLDQVYPIWTWTLTFEFLRDKNDTRGGLALGAGFDELRSAAGLYLACQGSFGTFLFDDPTDNATANQLIGTGNGSTTDFQLVRTFGAFVEPVYAPHVVSAIYDNGVIVNPVNYTVSTTTGIVTFTSAPANTHVITGNFTYYFRCRFSDDRVDFENFLYQLWTLKQLKFQSVLP